MKKLSLIAALSAIVLMSSCKNEELEKAKADYQQLLREVEKKDSSMLDLQKTFNDIGKNLQIIKDKENIINSNLDQDGMPKEYEEKVMDDIQAIYTLMEANKGKIEQLKEKLSRTRGQLSRSNKKLDAATKQLMEYEQMITVLTEQMEQKDEQILALGDRLTSLSSSLDSLNQEYVAKSQFADQQTKALNTAYYVFDSKKGLKENNIIESKGGVIGIGAAQLPKSDFNKEYFTKIDIMETKMISLYAKKAKILTNHPSSSYELVEKDGKIEKLNIKKPIEFWGSSKYLVIMTE